MEQHKTGSEQIISNYKVSQLVGTSRHFQQKFGRII